MLGDMGQDTNSGFGAKSTAEEVTKGIDASGLTAIVTGEFLRRAFPFVQTVGFDDPLE